MSRLSLFGAFALLSVSAPVQAQDWRVDREASSVGFETEAFGATTSGTFPDWTAEITLDPTDLTSARINARVTTGTGTTGNSQYDDSMLGPAGLAPESHAQASFVSDDIRETETGYAAHGVLDLRGTPQDAVMEFTLAITDDRAVADGHVDVMRADFGVGDASWGEIASEVRIIVHIEADAAD